MSDGIYKEIGANPGFEEILERITRERRKRLIAGVSFLALSVLFFQLTVLAVIGGKSSLVIWTLMVLTSFMLGTGAYLLFYGPPIRLTSHKTVGINEKEKSPP